MKSKFSIGQTLFVVQYVNIRDKKVFESKIIKITKDFLYLEGLDFSLRKDTLRPSSSRYRIEAFLSKEHYLIEKERTELYVEIKRKYFPSYQIYNFTLDQLKQIEKLLETF